MDISVETLWTMVLELLQSQLSHPTFEAWIKTATAEELTTERLVIRTPHPFARNWLIKYYLPSISTSVAEILGYPVEVQILSSQANVNLELEKEEEPSAEIANSINQVVSSEAIAPRHNHNLNPKYVFSRFVVGSASRMAHAAALAVAESPGREFNPLFLCGGVGLGKTHLMQAIAHYRLEIVPDAKIAYVSTEQFTNDLITAIRKDAMQAFRENYRDVDMILVDDIQFIEGKEYTQEEFFHTFNALYEKGKQIIIASDRPPTQIPRLQERLSSRFSMGLIADIQVPDLETRTAILQKKAEYENLRIPSEVLHYIAASYTSNVRELEGALVRAVAYISISGLPMTIENVAPVLNPPKEPLEISPELVLSVVADFMDVELSELQGSSRRREVSQARQVAMYLMRQHTSLSLPKIGFALGGKDHTTVMYSCEKITKLQAKDADTAQLLRELSDRIYLIAQSDNSKAV
ncbi:chromosomal replication initiator protein DnaA [Synechococcus sp. PCC 7502]|uniref:chromosomal replication initiator protein DnaA n=1 Tax=Synechococcus sp. PCC 7502 TaxID=1173263 RepID=UPI00029FB819|nr:chromosomal replication initiator protein DnaA [Synechococcus sp. PCC 7502]AFY72176.1 chromosomal replication initiator protein DnaA [Synechococcus sp. PCC 7502]